MTNPIEHEYTRPWLYAKQEAAFFNDARYSWTEASPKSGKTVGGMTWLNEEAMVGKRGQEYWWVAPVFGQTKIAWTRFTTGLPREVFTANETDLTITLANGAIMSFRSGDKPDTLYGPDVYAAVIL